MKKKKLSPEEKKIEEIIEMGSLLTPLEAFESMCKVWGIDFIDCSHKNESNKKQPIRAKS